MTSKKVPLYTIEETVPKQQQGADKLEKYLSGIWATVKENGKLVQLTRSSVQKLMSQQMVSLNGNVIKEKTCKVRANDVIVLRLFSLDVFKQQDDDGERKAQQDLKKQYTVSQQPLSNNKSNNSKLPSNNENINNEEINLVATEMKLDILYEDEWLAVINKPAGILVHPTPQGNNENNENQTQTLVNGLLHKYGNKGLSTIGGLDRPGIVHRLDKDTAGILIIAKNDNVHQQLKEMLQEHTEDSIGESKKSSKTQQPKIQKRYCCLVVGKPKEQRGLIKRAIARHPQDKNKMIIDEDKGKPSLTEYNVTKSWTAVEIEVRDKKIGNSTTTTTNNNDKPISTLDEYDTVVNKVNNNKKKKKNKSTISKGFQSLAIEGEEEEDNDAEDKIVKQESENESTDEEEDDEVEVEKPQVSIKKEILEEKENYHIKKKKVGSGSYSLLDIILHTGRTHQIRVHTLSEGVPIVGDPIYSGKSKQFMVPYLLLASVYLCFTHPITKEKKEFTIPYPPHIQEFIDKLDQAEKEKQQQQHVDDEPQIIKSKAHKITSTTSTKKQLKQKQYLSNSDAQDELLFLSSIKSKK